MIIAIRFFKVDFQFLFTSCRRILKTCARKKEGMRLGIIHRFQFDKNPYEKPSLQRLSAHTGCQWRRRYASRTCGSGTEPRPMRARRTGYLTQGAVIAGGAFLGSVQNFSEMSPTLIFVQNFINFIIFCRNCRKSQKIAGSQCFLQSRLQTLSRTFDKFHKHLTGWG